MEILIIRWLCRWDGHSGVLHLIAEGVRFRLRLRVFHISALRFAELNFLRIRFQSILSAVLPAAPILPDFPDDHRHL